MARRILLVVEGEKQERRLFKQIFKTFDFDSQDNRFDADGLVRMQEYFCESTDEGKL